MAKLVVITGSAEQIEIPIKGDMVIGRADECDVVVHGPFSSRQHARITVADGEYFVEDLNSANGTFVNGSIIHRTRLHDGDWIGIGDSRLTFVLGDDAVLPQVDLMFDDTSIPTVVETLDVTRPTVGETGAAAPAEVGRLRAQLAALREVAEKSCGSLDIHKLLDQILDLLLNVYPQADHVHAILLGFNESGGDMHLSRARGGRRTDDGGLSRTLLEIATSQQRAVLASDVGDHAELEAAVSIVQQQLRSLMCSPLAVGSRMLGAIQVDTCQAARPFSVDDLHLLVTIAGQVAVTAENARLHREVVHQQRLAAVGQAISSIAHCIKNSINSLQGGSYILDLGVQKGDPEKIAKGWEMVKRNTSFMSDLVKDMLAYCRKGAARTETTNIEKLLGDMVGMVRDAAAYKGVTVSMTLCGQAPPVEVDPIGIKRVLLNLLGNSIEACSEGGHVELIAGANQAGDGLQISVEDDGLGMPAEVRDHLFEPFFTTKGSKGTGLGLALVKKVVEEHGGRVAVESEVGRGTAVRMSIPLRQDEQKTALKKL